MVRKRWTILLSLAFCVISVAIVVYALRFEDVAVGAAKDILDTSIRPSVTDVSHLSVRRAVTNRFRVWDDPKVTWVLFEGPANEGSQDIKQALIDKAVFERATVNDDDRQLASRIFPGPKPSWWPAASEQLDYLEIGQSLWVFADGSRRIYLARINY